MDNQKIYSKLFKGLHMNHHPKSLGDMYACQEDRVFGKVSENWSIDLQFTYWKGSDFLALFCIFQEQPIWS